MSLLDRLRRLPSLLFVLVLACGSLACAPYSVIMKSGPPSALVGMTAIAVQFDYSNVGISNKRLSEQEWLDTREKDEHRNTYLETKESANIGILEGLQKDLAGVQITPGQAPPGGIQITVSYIEWEEGLWAGPIDWPSAVKARAIFSRDGVTLDEIEIKTSENASVFTPAPQQRIHTCGQRLGKFISQFIHDSGA